MSASDATPAATLAQMEAPFLPAWIEAEAASAGDLARRTFDQLVDAGNSELEALANVLHVLGRSAPGWLTRAIRAELDADRHAAFDAAVTAGHAPIEARRLATDLDEKESR